METIKEARVLCRDIRALLEEMQRKFDEMDSPAPSVPPPPTTRITEPNILDPSDCDSTFSVCSSTSIFTADSSCCSTSPGGPGAILWLRAG